MIASEAQHVQAGRPDGKLLLPVSPEGAWTSMEVVTVEFDRKSLAAPQEVELEATERDIRIWYGQARFADQPEQGLLSLGSTDRGCRRIAENLGQTGGSPAGPVSREHVVQLPRGEQPVGESVVDHAGKLLSRRRGRNLEHGPRRRADPQPLLAAHLPLVDLLDPVHADSLP